MQLKDCSIKAWLFLIKVIRHLQYWNIIPFVSCGSKEAGIGCMGHIESISKGQGFWVPKDVNLRFKRTKLAVLVFVVSLQILPIDS